MMGVVFLAAVLGASAVLGLPVAVHPNLGHLSLPARASVAWATGSLFLTISLTILSAIGLKWTPWWIMLACTTASALGALLVQKTRAVRLRPSNPAGLRFSLGSLCFTLIAGGGLFAFVFGVATSADLSYFWGVKSVHFALERGIDFELLRQPYMIHLHPNYPPLWPVLLAWGAMVAKSMPWLAIPSLTWFCLTTAAAIIFSVLGAKLGARAASVVTCLWYAVLTTMTVTSFSGGNADGPLVLFLSLALAIILTESENGPRPLRWLAAIALAGAVFTKSEGPVAVALIVVGTVTRDLMWRRPAVFRQTVSLIAPAAATAVLWVVVRIVHDIPLTDPIRETIFQFRFDHIELIMLVCTRILTTGVVVVGWLVPLVAGLMGGRGGLVRAVPGVVTALGILTFAVAYYLHVAGDPLQLIVWTFPRLIQPALTAWILGLGVAAFAFAGEREEETAFAEDGIR
jgi:hypothetical protein